MTPKHSAIRGVQNCSQIPRSTPRGSLKKCPKCKTYAIKNICKKCNSETKSAHYKFLQIRDAPPRSAPFKRK